MAEEFHDSDVIIADHRHLFHPSLDYAHTQILITTHRSSRNDANSNSKDSAASLPVKIPETVYRYNSSDMEEVDEDWDIDDDIVPPHVIIGRRVAGKMAFSLCTGNGRTLKGRDLSQVRNSILRMTGFLET
ncbi:uncharacterized protein LOC111477622 [Cucurbita maxima]|uniref:Uncharacterized protein LOC111477622 n=1 Tax=Cucurbita maxima TaxID=3661 RepID=A0A6J1IQW7_CUCMA|nr:uncharacterized protein LOC111477622 [Cucurbita maxima]